MAASVARNNTKKCRNCDSRIKAGEIFAYLAQAHVCGACIDKAHLGCQDLIKNGEPAKVLAKINKTKAEARKKYSSKAAWRRNFRKYCKSILDKVAEAGIPCASYGAYGGGIIPQELLNEKFVCEMTYHGDMHEFTVLYRADKTTTLKLGQVTINRSYKQQEYNEFHITKCKIDPPGTAPIQRWITSTLRPYGGWVKVSQREQKKTFKHNPEDYLAQIAGMRQNAYDTASSTISLSDPEADTKVSAFIVNRVEAAKRMLNGDIGAFDA